MLRFDPPAGAVTSICDIRLDDDPVQFEVVEAFEVDYRMSGDCLRLDVDAVAVDPRISLRIQGNERLEHGRFWTRLHRIARAVSGLLIVVFLVLSFRAASRVVANARAVACMQALDRRLAVIAAVWMLLLGGAYAMLTPPGAVADEEAHVAKVVRIHTGVLWGDGAGEAFANVRRGYGPFVDYLGNKSAFTWQQLRDQISAPLDCRPETQILAPGANGYFPHQYALATGIYALACAGKAPFGVFLYGARLLNLLLAAWLVYKGIRWAKRGRWGLFAVAVLPMSLFQMASLSADSLWLSSTLAWLGLLSGLAARTVAPRSALPWLVGIGLCIALLKPGSAWVLAAFLFARPAYASGRAFIGAAMFLVLLPWGVHLAWTLTASSSAPVRAGVDQMANVQVLVHHPWQFAQLLMVTFSGDSLHVMVQRLIGVLGWLDVPLSAWAYPIALLALVAAFFANDLDQPDSMRQLYGGRMMAAVMGVGAAVMTVIPLYLFWTLPGASQIDGVQGRYFLSVLAFILCWASADSRGWSRFAMLVYLLLAMAAVGADGAWRLLDAYYISGR